MNCKRVKELSELYLSEGLKDAEKAGFLAHLKECGLCRKESELLSKSWESLDLYKAPVLGDEFIDSLMAKIRSGQGEARTPIFSFNPFGFSLSARAVLAGWWKVPAFTLASCVIYLISIETGLMPSRQFTPLAAVTSQDGTETLSAMLSGGQTPDAGRLLTLVSEGADQ